jgi:hypothetical protein
MESYKIADIVILVLGGFWKYIAFGISLAFLSPSFTVWSYSLLKEFFLPLSKVITSS